MIIIVFTMIFIVATIIYIVFTKIGNVLKFLKYAWVNFYIIALCLEFLMKGDFSRRLCDKALINFFQNIPKQE